MSQGGTVVTPLGRRRRVVVFAQGPVEIRLGHLNEVKAQSDTSVSITERMTSVKVRQPAESEGGTQATGARSVAVEGTNAGIISTGDRTRNATDGFAGIIATGRDNVIRRGGVDEPLADPDVEGTVVFVPAGVKVVVHQAAELNYDPKILEEVEIKDERE